MNTSTTLPRPGLLKRLYDWALRSAETPKATWIVTLVSFAESSFFPLPPDLMLIPMVLANRSRAWWLAVLCTISSVAGGALGYAIGYYLFETLGEWIIAAYNLAPAFEKFQEEFNLWGFWIIALKGLTPIPYKLVTIASGVAGFNFTQFIIASFIARSFRFFMLSGILWFFGEHAKKFIEKNLTLTLLVTLGALVVGFFLVKLLT